MTGWRLDLLLNHKALREGLAYDYQFFPIPYGPDYTLAVAFVDWVVAELHKRDVQVKVHHRKTKNGVVFALEDVTPYEGRSS